MWKLMISSFCVLTIFLSQSNAQQFDAVPLSRLVDCTAFAASLQTYYTEYRDATSDKQYFKSEKRAKIIRDVWVSALNKRAEKEIKRQRDMDALNAQMSWIHDSARKLPELAGYGNAVVIFENRIDDCLRDIR